MRVPRSVQAGEAKVVAAAAEDGGHEVGDDLDGGDEEDDEHDVDQVGDEHGRDVVGELDQEPLELLRPRLI